MNTKTFNENYDLDRKSNVPRAVPKNGVIEVPEIKTADGVVYDRNETYYFFDQSTRSVRQSIGLRRDGTHLCTFGLRVVAVADLRANRDDALSDGQRFFRSEIENLQSRIAEYELEKTTGKRSLKTFLMAKE